MEQTVGYHFMKNNHVTDTTLVMDLISQRTPAAKAIGCGKCGTNAVPNDVVKRCSCANSDGGSKHNSRSKGIVLTCMVKVDLIRVVTGTAFPCSCVEGFGFVWVLRRRSCFLVKCFGLRTSKLDTRSHVVLVL